MKFSICSKLFKRFFTNVLTVKIVIVYINCDFQGIEKSHSSELDYAINWKVGV